MTSSVAFQTCTQCGGRWPSQVFVDGKCWRCRTPGLREFTTAPNGDFVAYYPDWFGMDGAMP